MATFEEIQKMRELRKKARKKKQIRTLIIIALIFIIILLSVIFIKNKLNYHEFTLEDSLALYPEPQKKQGDILEALTNDGVKVAYLTFDDGPTTAVTPSVLDILRRYNVKATFFMVGSNIEKNPALAYRVYNEGHLLANHSNHHDYNYLYANETNFMSEIDGTHEIIKKITGRESYPKIFRFPGGSYNSGSYGAMKQTLKDTLSAASYRYCDWNCLSGDAEYKSPDVDTLLSRIKSSSSGKEDLVILMHDSATKKINISALPAIIEYLISEGYQFDTLDNAP